MSEGDSPAILIRGLTFTYEGKKYPALADINLRVNRGEVVLIAGRSGSGKSTLLKCINGLIPHRYAGTYQGEVWVSGILVPQSTLSLISKHVGTVMQEVSKQLVLPMVLDDVAFGLCNQCIPADEARARAERALSRMNVAHLANRDVNELSGGEKQRVAIAGVLAMNPPIILMDEPLANLDSDGVKLVQGLIREFKSEGRTVVIAEHRVEEILEAGVDRIVVMESGRIVKEARAAAELSEFAGKLKLPAWVVGTSRRLPAWQGPSGGQVAIEFRNVFFSYDSKPALRGVNLQIREGERVALLGNNGAGKSTMAKLMLGIIKPTSGEVLVYGTDTRRKEVFELASIVGLVFQDPFYMLFARTVREELEFGPRNIGVPADQLPERVEEAARHCKVDHLLSFSPFSSSHGEKKRICVASIIAMRPKVLILDEPTAGQDYESYTAFMNFILELHARGVVKTLILITHDTDLALEYTDRTVVLSDGQVIADGPTARVLVDPEVLSRGRIRETSLVKLAREAGSRVWDAGHTSK